MDPPRKTARKGTKKRGGKRMAPRADHLHDPYDPISPPHANNVNYESDLDSSFDELDLSDAECPALDGEQDALEDDDAPVQKLYQGPRRCRCCINWVKTLPQGIAASSGNQVSPKHAIIARYSSKKQDTQLVTSVHSVTVKSQSLKDVLAKVLDTYPGINIGRGDANFYPPFQPLVHVWSVLKACISELEGEARDHGNSFCEIIEPEIGETMNDRDDLLSRGLVTFDLLWTLYKPGSLVFCMIDGTRHLMEISRTTEEQSAFTIHLIFWDLSQKTALIKSWSEWVFHFTGTRAIAELEAIPFELFPNAEDTMEVLRLRGQKIRDIPEGALKWFEGFVTVPIPGSFDTRKKWITGRVVIDPQEYDKMVADTSIPMCDPLTPLPGATKLKDGVEEVSPEQLSQSSSMVRGFSIATKSWHKFEVDCISEIEWNDSAFDQLVMPSNRKRLIKALVDSNQGRSTGFDDFIKGKGQGLIMLLSGKPGTGKTLTAESIAERIHLPLYSVHSSELSAAVAADIEAKLGDILHRAAHWNAVLLIDEADAFLEARNVRDIDRNQRVAVFLRLLEFYSGVLILTTNRRISFDPAFHSRIHLTLKFDDLDHSARASVWKNFLRRMPNNVHENDVEQLAQANLNGRQIKSCVKLASLLAHSEGETLCTEHLETMLEAVDEIADDRQSGSEDGD